MYSLLFRILGSLALLMFGMKLMSDTLQKMAGPQLRHVLAKMTTNRFTGMLTGIFVTASVQSSTATTVMTVSFVNAGLLTLAQAISVIMGANIGTTLTAWIMSVASTFDVTSFVWPTFVIAMVLIFKNRHASLGEFLFGVAFMIYGLGTLRQTGSAMNLGENEAVLSFFMRFDPNSFSTTLLFLLIGGILTMCVQSSAAVMAITMTLCASGALPIYQGIALVMGENIGTTVTSNLAALTASTQARRAAFAHMLFNIFGVCWMLLVFHPFVDGVCNLVGYAPERLSIVLATFHTCFNVVNTAILIWFIPQIERIVCWVIKDKGQTSENQMLDEEPITRLHYVETGLMKTPEIAILEAQREIIHFGERAARMFGMVEDLLDEHDDSAFVKLYSRIEKYESISDNMELEIAQYLEQVSDAHLSDDSKGKIRDMLREISELESVCDGCFNLARTLNRRVSSGDDFTPTLLDNIRWMFTLVRQAITQMNVILSEPRNQAMRIKSQNIETEINNFRNRAKAQNVLDVNAHAYTYALGTLYIDLITQGERIGDYVINVVDARFSTR